MPTVGSQNIFPYAKKLYIPATQFTGVAAINAYTPAGTITATITKGAIVSGTEIGLSADSTAGVLTNNTIAATRVLSAPGIAFTGTAAAPTMYGAGTLTAASAAPFGRLVSTNAVVGLKTNTDGQDIGTFIPVPFDLDRSNPVNFRIVWTSASNDTADTVLWKVFYGNYGSGTLIANASTALDTVVPTDNVLGMRMLHITEPGVLNANKLTSDYVELLVEMDTKAVGLSEDIWLLGLELEYTVQIGRYARGRRAQARPVAGALHPSP